MKTVQFNAFGSTDVLEYTDLSVPSPLADQVLIEVKAAGVNTVGMTAFHERPTKKQVVGAGVVITGLVLLALT